MVAEERRRRERTRGVVIVVMAMGGVFSFPAGEEEGTSGKFFVGVCGCSPEVEFSLFPLLLPLLVGCCCSIGGVCVVNAEYITKTRGLYELG